MMGLFFDYSIGVGQHSDCAHPRLNSVHVVPGTQLVCTLPNISVIVVHLQSFLPPKIVFKELLINFFIIGWF
ncbi:hypothetical protein ATB97_10685 [Elizabethkingia bruuniana]|nr:hypothetical protein AYC65_20365 [Elizabethkingia bruuniana]KGO09391.1 hypothetical protein KS04_15240 [Elizabethkingia miricola]KUY23835.1 hypothetical protein ATB97_10685 [Elizabethkingia bruuniana]OPB61573.1 hypothetical protein BAY12_13940 [Elizabethkingia bruuniana]